MIAKEYGHYHKRLVCDCGWYDLECHTCCPNCGSEHIAYKIGRMRGNKFIIKGMENRPKTKQYCIDELPHIWREQANKEANSYIATTIGAERKICANELEAAFKLLSLPEL